jgi:hypothetical protein
LAQAQAAITSAQTQLDSVSQRLGTEQSAVTSAQERVFAAVQKLTADQAANPPVDASVIAADQAAVTLAQAQPVRPNRSSQPAGSPTRPPSLRRSSR